MGSLRIGRQPVVVESIFDTVDTEVLESRLTFPDREEFVRYFKATMLYEQIAEQRSLSDEQMIEACATGGPVPLSKEMLALVARR